MSVGSAAFCLVAQWTAGDRGAVRKETDQVYPGFHPRGEKSGQQQKRGVLPLACNNGVWPYTWRRLTNAAPCVWAGAPTPAARCAPCAMA